MTMSDRERRCRRGHLIEGKECAECHRIRARAKTAARGGKPRAGTHCQQGHEFTEDNTIITSEGRRRCRHDLRFSRHVNHRLDRWCVSPSQTMNPSSNSGTIGARKKAAPTSVCTTVEAYHASTVRSCEAMTIVPIHRAFCPTCGRSSTHAVEHRNGRIHTLSHVCAGGHAWLVKWTEAA